MENFKSSTGKGVSRTVKGILTTLIPVAVIIAEQFGVPLSNEGLTEGITIIAGIIGSAVALSGYVRAKRYLRDNQ